MTGAALTGLIIGIIAGIVGIGWALDSWVIPRIRGKSKDLEKRISGIEDKVGQIAEYIDGLPTAPPEIKDPFTEGMAHKENYEYGEAITLFRQALALGPTGTQRAALLLLIGNCFLEQAELEEAEGHYREAEAAAIEADDEEALATIYNNIGGVYNSRGDYDRALDWLQRSLKLTEDIGDRAGLATTYNNIGLIHKARGDYDQALDWYQKSLKIKEEIGDRAGLATTLSNIGGVYYSRSDYDQALQEMQRALAIFEEIGAKDKARQVKENIETLKAERRKRSKK